MSFWRPSESYAPGEFTPPPPVTDAMVAACEKDFGIKFPASLVTLLKTQNGGELNNHDFRIDGKDFAVYVIEKIEDSSDLLRICPLTRRMDAESQADEIEKIKKQIGNPNLILPFDGDGHYYHALNYNEQGADAEPSVIFLEIEGDISFRKIASSFAEFLSGQYEGDPQPIVQMEEANNYRVIVEGGYEGFLNSTRTDVRISWKICSHRSHLIVFQEEDWGWRKSLKRVEFKKSDLVFSKPETKKYDPPLHPDCYRLHLQVQPFTHTMTENEATAYKGRWKNSSSATGYATLYSNSRPALEEAMEVVPRNSTGLKRFFS